MAIHLNLTEALSCEMWCSTFSFLMADRLLRPLPVAGLFRPIDKGIADLSSPRSFFDIVVLGGGGLGDMAEALVDDVVALCGSGDQVVKVGVKIQGQVGTIREIREGVVVQRMDRDRVGVNDVKELGGGRCAE